MQFRRAAQKDRGISLRVCVRPGGLTAARDCGQGRYPQQLNSLPFPLLLYLVPMLAMFVGAEEDAVAIQRQLGTFHH